MFVAAAMLGPRFPLWVFAFEPTTEERAEAERVLATPFPVVATAQRRIERARIEDRELPRADGRVEERGVWIKAQTYVARWGDGANATGTIAEIAASARIGKDRDK